MEDEPGPDELARLLLEAAAASPESRIEYRDRIASHGDAAISLLAGWLSNAELGAFAVRGIEAAAKRGSVALASDVLLANRPGAADAVQRDIDNALAKLRSSGRPAVVSQQTSRGVTIVGRPVDGETYSPPLSSTEQGLITYLENNLPAGWTMFVRPHLDGDRPALALLDKQRGAMVWDVRDWDLSDVVGTRAHLTRTGEPYPVLDPINRINAVRERLYREYLPGWAEAIDSRPQLFGIVRAGILFADGQPSDLDRLELSGRRETVLVGRGWDRLPVGQVVPNANRQVEMQEDWHQYLTQRFSDYHPPAFGAIPMTLRQRELAERDFRPEAWGIDGVAGTGKSLILARRAAMLAETRKVLLLSYNLTLANYCRGLVEDAPRRFLWRNLVVQHFHGLCATVLRSHDQPAPAFRGDDETPADPDDPNAEEAERVHYDEAWPAKTLAAIRDCPTPDDHQFDVVLVDEGQDFGSRFIDVVDGVLRPRGELLFGFDRAQKLYARGGDAVTQRAGRRISKLNGTRRMRSRLINIANSLATHARLATDPIELDDDPALFGDAAAWWVAADDAADALATATAVVQEWREERSHRPDSVAILVPSQELGIALTRLLQDQDIDSNHVFPSLKEIRDPENVGARRLDRPHKVSFVPHDQRLKVCAIHSFKGWDADSVVLVLPPTGSRRSTSAYYVALTRAQTRLAVVAMEDPHGLRPQFDDLDVDVSDDLRKRAAAWLRAAESIGKRRPGAPVPRALSAPDVPMVRPDE